MESPGLNRFRELALLQQDRRNHQSESVSGKNSIQDWLLNMNTMQSDDTVETYDADFDNIPPELEAIFPEHGVSRRCYESLKRDEDTDVVPNFNFSATDEIIEASTESTTRQTIKSFDLQQLERASRF